MSLSINSKTCVYAVIGNPVSHSLSPVMHNRAFSRLGINGVYVAMQVADIAPAVSGVRALGIKGASITIPHKETVAPYLDEIEETAKAIGAVNTVINRKGVLTGCNTDCSGAMKALSAKTDIKNREVMIIGAGGAARAIGFGIVSEGGRVFVANRSEERGAALARDLGGTFCPLSVVEKAGCHILINTTSVGMTPDIEAMPVKPEVLKKDMVVMDIVYNPLKTRLLKTAEETGCILIDGVQMFVFQGAAQFEMWTGEKAPVETMKQAVLEQLQENAGPEA